MSGLDVAGLEAAVAAVREELEVAQDTIVELTGELDECRARLDVAEQARRRLLDERLRAQADASALERTVRRVWRALDAAPSPGAFQGEVYAALLACPVRVRDVVGERAGAAAVGAEVAR